MSQKGYYPVFLDVDGKKCVVVGGGQVARRKVETLLENGAKVVVISPELCPELVANKQITVKKRNYLPGDLAGAFLAVVATDSRETNHRAADECRASGVLVNVVDDTEYCDFILPSVVQRGDIAIAISTGGKSPALARKLRTRLEKEFGEEYAVLTGILDEVRRDIKRRGLSVDAETWQKALDLDRLTDLITQGKTEEAREIVTKKLLMQTRQV
jgi:precorrin-2 dehydrogenase / sirohydrochlorin ferrochelatase